VAGISLKLSGISKTYPGVRALHAMDLECRAGEVHAVLGENGSGKSTLLGIASGSVTPDGGVIEICGKVLASADPLMARSLGLATVYQDDSLIRELSVAQNLYLASMDPSLTYGRIGDWAHRQLREHDLALSPATLVSELTPAERQFLEIVKALISRPKVLLLDEPTSTLDLEGVRKLASIIKRLAAAGTAIVYVSHRLPEILEFADRVTILRDGVGRGTHAVNASLSEHDLIALMIGRSIEAEYPAKGAMRQPEPVMAVSGFSGSNFRDISFSLAKGEILGFAGAEGNGQRDTIRALGGLSAANGTLLCNGRVARSSTPGEAVDAGIVFLSADRSAESVFPELGVRENMTLQVLDRFAKAGMVSRKMEEQEAARLVESYGIVTPSLEQPVHGLSGGNQQKTVLARSFLYGARVVLIDEPTQGVDAGARFEIYRAIRGRVNEGTGCIVNSSDALELAGICDRVLVFSRGRIIRELSGAEVTESNIVSSFLMSKDAHGGTEGAEAPTFINRAFAMLTAGGSKWWIPLLFLLALTILVGAYAALRSDVFLTAINLRHILLATAPLALVAMAQFNVLLVRGFDISVGSLMSVTVVTGSFLVAANMGAGQLSLGLAVCLAIGLAVGVANGVMIRFAGVNAVITTIASLSILQGIALLLRPTPGGLVNPGLTGFLKTQIGPLPASFFVLILAAIAGDYWLHRTKSGLKLQAVGFRETAARRNGVRVDVVHLRAYVLSSLLAVAAGFFLASEVGVGHPTIGSTYTLTSIAAAVLGGAALTGGRGSFLGTLFGALFFTLTVNVISLLGLNTAVGIIVSGALTLLAVFIYSGLKPAELLLRRMIGLDRAGSRA
jgi:ribose transport system ATP-binding protein